MLLIGAMRAETLPILGALRRRRPLTSRLVSGELGGVPVAVLTCGVGPARAARRTMAALPHTQAQVVVSLGTCGALVDDLSIGDVITADRILDEGACFPVAPLPDVARCTVVTVATPVWSADRRAVLAAAGASVCEMEAAAIRAVIGARSFSALKVVSDHAGAEQTDPPERPGPMAIARFSARAGRLCQRRLLPVLQAALHTM